MPRLGGALETLKVNLLGPLMLMKWFGDFLPKKSKDLSHVGAAAAEAPQGANREEVGGAPAGLELPAQDRLGPHQAGERLELYGSWL